MQLGEWMSHAAVAMFTTDVESVCVACAVRDEVEDSVPCKVRYENEETVELWAYIECSTESEWQSDVRN